MEGTRSRHRGRALLAAGSILALIVVAAPARAVVYSQYTYERVMVPMRDDVRLSVDIWRPVTPPDVRIPVILTLSPYHILSKALDRGETDPPAPWGSRFVPRGYAYVVADVRGTYNSGG
ncbi:MAG TPA: CocE/NonD family hydrolase, partial [Actinomycetota bacterium]